MLRELDLFDMTEEESELFSIAVGTWPQSGGRGVVSKAVHAGKYRLVTIERDSLKVVMILDRVVLPDQSVDLVVLMMAGRNALARYEECVEDTMGLAIDEQCDRIVAYITPERLVKFASSMRGAVAELVQCATPVIYDQNTRAMPRYDEDPGLEQKPQDV